MEVFLHPAHKHLDTLYVPDKVSVDMKVIFTSVCGFHVCETTLLLLLSHKWCAVGHNEDRFGVVVLKDGV